MPPPILPTAGRSPVSTQDCKARAVPQVSTARWLSCTPETAETRTARSVPQPAIRPATGPISSPSTPTSPQSWPRGFSRCAIILVTNPSGRTVGRGERSGRNGRGGSSCARDMDERKTPTDRATGRRLGSGAMELAEAEVARRPVSSTGSTRLVTTRVASPRINRPSLPYLSCFFARPKSGASVSCPASMIPRLIARVRVK